MSNNAPLELKNPPLAALLAWLIPGAGHLYQGRTAKGILFLVCILGTFLYGLYLGDGKVVYTSWQGDDFRLYYLAQVGVGLPALPALFQSEHSGDEKSFFAAWMARPAPGEVGAWHKNLHRYFELGTVYTVIAGLLNLLVIYDAYAGPVPVATESGEKKSAPSAQPA
jgi:TM2 domain-containing membrane protein YozV